MVIFKCKMCGGSLSVSDGATVAECEYCGTKQTVSTSNDEVIVNLFNRANNLRLKSEYDKAAEVYEKILDLDNTQAEAHWGMVLCKYGVEYVEDPLTKERIPTCHRTQMTSLLTDADYQSVLQFADFASRAIYKEQAEAINELQKNILEIVKTEEPFDVFICYKETDESGARTKDSVIANEIYHELTNTGLKVFFSAITLEDKLGEEYEPYIFAALTSAKVMLVLGTKPEYFNAVWVRNEWSRYLHLMKIDRQTKRTLIPCFRDMDAYDLPDEFSHLQALDMASIAFMPDLTRNIQKLIGTPVPSTQQQNVPAPDVSAPAVQIAPLLKRAFMIIEDGEFNRADELLETVLNNDPENARAYLGKLMCNLKVRSDEKLVTKFTFAVSKNPNYRKACRFADEELKKQLDDYPYRYACYLKESDNYVDAMEAFQKLADYKDSEKQAEDCMEQEQARIYDMALQKMKDEDYVGALTVFDGLGDFRDSVAKVGECKELENQSIYNKAMHQMKIGDYRGAADLFKRIREYRDSGDKAKECFEHIERLKEEADEAHNQKIYDRGVFQMNAGEYDVAYSTFNQIRSFKDASAQATKCKERFDRKKRNEKIGEVVKGGIFLSIPVVPVSGIIGFAIGFIVNICNAFSTGRGFKIWDWGICTDIGLLGCVIGLIIAFIISYSWTEPNK